MPITISIRKHRFSIKIYLVSEISPWTPFPSTFSSLLSFFDKGACFACWGWGIVIDYPFPFHGRKPLPTYSLFAFAGTRPTMKMKRDAERGVSQTHIRWGEEEAPPCDLFSCLIKRERLKSTQGCFLWYQVICDFTLSRSIFSANTIRTYVHHGQDINNVTCCCRFRQWFQLDFVFNSI